MFGACRGERAPALSGDRLAAMTAWTKRTTSPFGRALTAVVSPMQADGSLDLAGLQKVVAHLLDNGHDGVVVNGTTGES
ncbi:MAG TPA: dihydrodipicolinate synthase family protein, partial [Lapillicoccus sp.]|nr:dihydrodipicolinate synthase family protein [Lapillicoccus sp.]